MNTPGLFAATLIATLLLPTTILRAQQAEVVLRPTSHQRLPAEASDFWLAPTAADARTAKTAAASELRQAIELEADASFTKALAILSRPALQKGPLALYASYYEGIAQLNLGHPAEAKQIFDAIAAKQPAGFLTEGVALRQGEVAEAQGDHHSAVDIYERLSGLKTTAPDDVLMRMGRAAKAAGESGKAIAAYSRVVYDFPFSDNATAAAAELENLPVDPITSGSARYKLELGRAERLFGAKRYQAARPVFESLRRVSSGDDRELIDLRVAECDYFLKHVRTARDETKPYIEKASRQGEALYFYAIATREAGDEAEYLRTIRRIVDSFPEQSWAEEALNNLGTYYILENDDEQADVTFRELYKKYPTGRYGERAAWKVGWWAYKNDRYADAIAAFESAAAHFTRSDYRPSWLYWSARAHEILGDKTTADERYTLVATDYLNSYYGRLAVKRLVDHGGRAPQRRLVADVDTSATDDGAISPVLVPPNGDVVRALLALELYDQAVDELHYAQKAWGDSSVIQATLAWIYNQRGDLRAGITAMKRAYPQYLAAGGEHIPSPILKVLFPVDYWPLIKRYSAQHDLDPYLIAALIAQESTFTADVRSAANAYGLMQLLPSTGRQYARRLRIRSRFSVRLLTTADTNLRMGTAYFADLVRQFGGVHYALATYNAGPNRVARWISERPGIDRDEFIDDIPFPETQNYVKKILGTAEDYRRLYGPGSAARADDDDADVKPAVRDTTRKAAPTKAAAAKKKSGTKSSSAKPKPKPKPKGKPKAAVRKRKAA